MTLWKITRCPKCHDERPPFTLCRVGYDVPLENGTRLDPLSNDIPDTRTYALVCLHCGNIMEKYKIDNTLAAVKAFRDELDAIYGKPERYPVVGLARWD